eukprot:3223401-Pyramimonas_sp.AAC.1
MICGESYLVAVPIFAMMFPNATSSPEGIVISDPHDTVTNIHDARMIVSDSVAGSTSSPQQLVPADAASTTFRCGSSRSDDRGSY